CRGEAGRAGPRRPRGQHVRRRPGLLRLVRLARGRRGRGPGDGPRLRGRGRGRPRRRSAGGRPPGGTARGLTARGQRAAGAGSSRRRRNPAAYSAGTNRTVSTGATVSPPMIATAIGPKNT